MIKALKRACEVNCEDNRKTAREVDDGAIAMRSWMAREGWVGDGCTFLCARDVEAASAEDADSQSSMPLTPRATRILFARIDIARRKGTAQSSHQYCFVIAGSEIEIISPSLAPNAYGRVVAVKDFVIVRDDSGAACAIEAKNVEAMGDFPLVIEPLCALEGVANDARSLAGKVGMCRRGVIEAVSPMICTSDSTFFQATLRGDDGERVEYPLIFNGEHLARWQCVLKSCVGTLVELRNLRKVVLFKGDPEHELRAFSAASEFQVALIHEWKSQASKVPLACRCSTCTSGATVGSYEADVTGVHADRGIVVLDDVVNLTFTHVPLSESKLYMPGLRVGAKVVVTHAHAVYRCDDNDMGTVHILGADLRTQIAVKIPALENSTDGSTVMYTGVDELERTSRLWRSFKYAVEQSTFVYAQALRGWCEAFQSKFDFLTDSRIVDVKVVEYALGLVRHEEDVQGVAPILQLVHDTWKNVHTRDDVYGEFFRPKALGGVARDAFDIPIIDALKHTSFKCWQEENLRADSGTRGSTRNEGKPVVRTVDRLGRESSQIVFGALQCLYGRTHLVDASGAIEVLVTLSEGAPAPSTSLLNKLVVIDECDIVCEGAYTGARACKMEHINAPVRVTIVVNANHIRALYPPALSTETAGTMFVAATFSKAGVELIPPRFAGQAVTRQINAPTWVLTLSDSMTMPCTTIQAMSHNGGIKSLRGVMRNTTHASKSRISLTFGGDNKWYSLMRFGSTYLVPVQSTGDLKAATFIVDERPGAVAYILPDDEDEDGDDAVSTSLPKTQQILNVRDVLVWSKVFVRSMVNLDSWQPAPESVSFKCVVVAEEWFQNEVVSQFGWESRLKVQDVETHDVVDIYCKSTAFSFPAGLGIGAVMTIRQATRHLSAKSMNIYVKLNMGVSTIEIHECSGATSSYLPKEIVQVMPRKSIRAMFLDQISSDENESVAIDRRTFEVRARVASVSMLQIRWCCPACGCDAGSVMRVSVNKETSAATQKLPAALAACEVCRTTTRGDQRPGVFEVEASVILDDGTAQAECWLTGQAGMVLMPVKVRNEVLSLVKRHGRVTSRLTRSSDEERDCGAMSGGHVVRGHGSNVLGGSDSATVRSAVSYATSIDEMIFECRKQYKLFQEDVNKPQIAALSFLDEEAREVRCGDFEIKTRCVPILRLWSASVTPINPRQELMLALSRFK